MFLWPSLRSAKRNWQNRHVARNELSPHIGRKRRRRWARAPGRMTDVVVPEKKVYGNDSDPGPGLGPEQWPEGSPQRLIYMFMEDSLWNRLVIVATIWALFVPDTKTVTLNTPEYDKVIALGTLASLCIFCFELLANFYVGRDYGGLEGTDKITCVEERQASPAPLRLAGAACFPRGCPRADPPDAMSFTTHAVRSLSSTSSGRPPSSRNWPHCSQGSRTPRSPMARSPGQAAPRASVHVSAGW
jgi:hypothetical protein